MLFVLLQEIHLLLLAAYAARAGIQSIVVIPKGKVALGKLAQACMYGAKIIEIDGNFDDALKNCT